MLRLRLWDQCFLLAVMLATASHAWNGLSRLPRGIRITTVSTSILMYVKGLVLRLWFMQYKNTGDSDGNMGNYSEASFPLGPLGCRSANAILYLV